jgi:hypothetical protein
MHGISNLITPATRETRLMTTLEAPPVPRCDLCSRPVDLTEPHVAVLRHIEREDLLGEVIVEEQEVLSTQHLDCTLPVVACACCHDDFGTFVDLANHRCAEMSAA